MCNMNVQYLANGRHSHSESAGWEKYDPIGAICAHRGRGPDVYVSLRARVGQMLFEWRRSGQIWSEPGYRLVLALPSTPIDLDLRPSVALLWGCDFLLRPQDTACRPPPLLAATNGI